MAKRVIVTVIEFATLFIATFGACWALNNATPRLSYGAILDAERANAGSFLSGWTNDPVTDRLRFQFNIPDGLPQLTLTVANTHSFDLYQNDRLIYSYDDTQSAERLQSIPLEETVGTVVLSLDFKTSHGAIRSMLGTTQQMGAFQDAGRLVFVLCMGMLLAVLLYCMSLLMRSPDNTIPLYMISLILLVALRDVPQSFPVASQLQATATRQTLNLAMVGGMALMSARYVFASFFERHRRLELGLAFGVVAFALVSLVYKVLWLSLASLLVLHLACAAILVCGAVQRIPWCPLLLAGFSFAFAVFSFYFLVDAGVFPAGKLSMQVYVIQFYAIPFLFACMTVLNRQFVQEHADLRRINRELDAEVEDRVAKLRSVEAQKRQLEINVFHDLRTPLFVAEGCIARIRGGEDLTTQLDLLNDRVSFMKRLTEDLFLIGKLESGELLLVEDRVNLNPLCRRQLDACAPLARERGIELEGNLALERYVWGDEYRIEQVLQNLLTNALAHTPAGGRITLTIEGDDATTLVHVRNTGRGIEPQALEHVFERYYHEATTESRGSSGLGLAIARQIMQAHRGDLTATSVVGQQTTFIATFPAI